MGDANGKQHAYHVHNLILFLQHSMGISGVLESGIILHAQLLPFPAPRLIVQFQAPKVPRMRGGRAWEMKGADRFMQYVLLCSAQCLPTSRMESGDTVMKKPAEYTTRAASTSAQFSGAFTWSTCPAQGLGFRFQGLNET